ncbi:MAG: hypothetical protein RR735_03790 [Bacteroidales bacterium]
MKKLFTLLISATLVFWSCGVDFNETKVPVNTTLPLADFNISESMLLSWGGVKEDILSRGDDDILQIRKSQEIEIGSSADLKDLFNISNQKFLIPYNFGGIVPAPIEININPIIKLSHNFVFEDNYTISNATLNNGEISFNVLNTVSDFKNVSCTIEQLTKNNNPLVIKSGETISLAGYELKLDNKSTLNFYLSGKISAKAGDNLSNINLNIAFSNLEILQAKGFFGRKEINPVNEFTINIDPSIIDFFKDCDYYLNNPQIKLQLSNAYNLPILVKISKLKIGDKEIKLKDGIGNSSILLKPEYITDYVLNNSSTLGGKELSEAISSNISSCTIAFTIITNPTKEDVGDAAYIAPTTNAIALNKSIKIQEDLLIPFDGMFTNVAFNQEFNMDLDNSNGNIYEYLKLGITCANEMPLNLNFTLVAVSNDNTESILLEEPVNIPASNGLRPASPNFKAGIIDNANAIIRTIPGEKVQAMITAKTLKFVFKGSMPKQANGEYSKLYSPSSLNLKLIGNLKGEF